MVGVIYYCSSPWIGKVAQNAVLNQSKNVKPGGSVEFPESLCVAATNQPGSVEHGPAVNVVTRKAAVLPSA